MKHNTFTMPLLQLAAATFVGRTEAAPVAEAASALVERAPNPYVEEAASGSDTNTESLSPRTANVNPHAKDHSGPIRAAVRHDNCVHPDGTSRCLNVFMPRGEDRGGS